MKEDDSYLSRIRAKYDALSASQKKIAQYLSDHPEEILTHSITSLSKRIGTTPPSLTKFCQLLHYKGFSDLKFCMEKQLAAPFSEELDIQLLDPVDTIQQKLLAMDVRAITDTLLQVDHASIKRAARAICAADMVMIYADGGNQASASCAYHVLLQLGVPCNYFSDFCLAKIAVAKLKPGNVALSFTFSGNSSTVLSIMEDAARRGAETVGVTAHSNSELVKIVSTALCYSPHIGDDLRYLHVARMCEIALIGFLQSTLINAMPEAMRANIALSKNAISSFRVK